MESLINVGILLFNEVEVLDFAGPFEVFSITSLNNRKPFNTVTIGETGATISARNGLKVTPEYSFTNAPKRDILIIPGGYGAEHIELKNTNLLRWIKEQQANLKILASVCTGAFILAETGLLNNLNATTHWMDTDKLQQDYPQINVVKKQRVVDEGSIITSGGVASGISMSLHIIARLLDRNVAITTAKRMEFDWE